MSRRPRSCVALLGFVLALVMLSGCQPGAGPNGGPVAGSQNGKAPTVAAKTLPAGLPSDLPVYAGTVVASAKATSGGTTTFSFTIETADGAQVVAEWYRTHFNGGGWTVASNYTKSGAAPFAMMSARKGSLQASVALGGRGGKTQVVCSLVVKS